MLKKAKYYILVSFMLWVLNPLLYSQDQKVADSLALIYKKGNLSDKARLDLLSKLSFNEVKDLKLSLSYAEELVNLSLQTGNTKYLHKGYFQIGNKRKLFGDLEEALQAYIKSAEYAHEENNRKGEGNTYGAMADIFSISGNHPNARMYYKKSIAILRESNDSVALASAILNAGDEFMSSEIYDTAFTYFQESALIFDQLNYEIGKAYGMGNMGMIYAKTGESELAEKKLMEAIDILNRREDYYPVCVYLITLADLHFENGDKFTAFEYAKNSLLLAQDNNLKEQIRDANLKLSELYETAGNSAESYRYYKNYIAYRDSINNIKSVQSIANMRTDYEVAQKQNEVDLLYQQRQAQRWWLIAIGTILCSAMILLIMFYRNNKTKQRTNIQLQEQKKKVETALANLKDTQAQLIHSEKMASLGELTAGIAHEIHNPLNFINNFSEMSIELIDEITDEIIKDDPDELKSLVTEIRQNLAKITHHGKRAEAIVKGMLQHSSSTTGEKELTDLNILAKEYLRLSYHGVMAKNKDFQGEYKIIPDPALPKIKIIPQEIGRVIINLINNAFYAVCEKAKHEVDGFKPEVIVSTKYHPKESGFEYVEVSVKDNGEGIPKSEQVKIFQPFYTTKPAGEGTGLGLSLSYDIVKAHNGTIELESDAEKGTVFTIRLPLSSSSGNLYLEFGTGIFAFKRKA